MKRMMVNMIFCVAFSAGLAAQSLESVMTISGKSVCTISDMSTMIPAFIDAFPEDTGLAARLKQALSAYKPEKTLTKAWASFVAAKSFRIRSSFFFVLIPLERYAFRALVVDGIFSSSSSGGETMNGSDLMDFVSAVSQKYGSAP